MIKKISAFLVAVFLLILFCGCKQKGLTIYDCDCNVFAIQTTLTPSDNEDFAYTDIILNEAVEILMQKNKLDKETAQKQLIRNNYHIYTFCQPEAIIDLKEAYDELSKEVNFGATIVDLNGNILAAYSINKTLETADYNFSVEKTPPYSSLKPLSVYAPALEHKKINWSSLVKDSPYKKFSDEYGKLQDWPSNSNNVYSQKDTTIFDAVKHSLNTVAVKVLSEFGVSNSIEFLNSNFNINLKTEEYKANNFGEEEVLGNIALGYTVSGASPLDMAGYYTIFANGGSYSEPKAIKKIVDNSGNTIYEKETNKKTVISRETAYIVNELLRGVVSTGGTGENAFCGDVQVAGKTGTGDNNSGNWFVGLTPEYSCAIWHSQCDKNRAAEIFSKLVKKSEIKNKSFMTCESVVKKIYCKESGKLFSISCNQVEMGYFTEDNLPTVCDIH